ncbi:phosphatidylinositide phosphatase SAC2 isoform X3 [Centruroides vittatus]|uniref:phosphatidylinositide phosphatase SAC2 isoform X3 n=1 Tax=Centruroides vittatus TaxID=120091 RepID=UPI0035101544
MELLMSNDYFILVDGLHSLWCSRIDGKLTAKKASQVSSVHSPVCLGVVYGVIGKFQVHSDVDKKLLLIRQRALVGCLPGGHEVYKIQKIAILPLNQHDVPELDIELCKRHHIGIRKTERSAVECQQRALQKTWNSIRTATAQVKPRRKDNKDREKLERRVLDELVKMFTDTDSFYYSLSGDITNTLQRQQAHSNPSNVEAIPLWKRVDERFFWNRHMLMELIESWNPQADHWIVPIIQGFVQIEKCWIDSAETPEYVTSPDCEIKDYSTKQVKEYTMTVISRRSRYRAGTRYKRRGVDEDGKCANYVETEQIFQYLSHIVSFVQVRGSVPVFWSQPGYKYRPPPQLDRGEEETLDAFAKHFAEELSIYGNQVIINLVEQTGKEKVLSEAYLNGILSYDCPDLTYISFDFHEYCRGMKFENITILTESIKDIIREMRYCWFDSQGLICEQKGVFRVNCVDCLDRTNIAQTALAKTIMDTQFIKLGLLPPEGILPASCRRVFQMMWANNGDIISRQYAGTAALKGDFTRTGERRFAGMMKDGYTSASRYYVNQFKDAYRQATIDLMLGNPLTEDITAVTPERDATDIEVTEQEHHERVKQLIEDCKKILIPDTEVVLGGWALIDADPITGDPGQQDMDIILVLTKMSYYVAEYDDQTDRIIRYQRVLLEDLERIELGPEPSLFKSKHNCLRLHYLVNSQSGYFHMFRSTNTRFFNNMAVPIRSEEEAAESLKAICEAFKVALGVKSLNVPFFEGKLERRKSKMPFAQGGLNCSNSYRGANRHAQGLVPFHLELPSFSAMPRNISEGQLNALKSVGTRALNNMTSHFAKLNPIRSVRGLGKRTNGLTTGPSLAAVMEPTGSLQRPLFHVESSSDSEDDSIRRRKKQGSSTFVSYINDRTLSSDYSECSDLDEPDLTVSESLERDEESGSQDTLLESCGILATSPSLKSSSSILSGLALVDDRHSALDNRHSEVDVDDFVLDAMKKATLRQLRRKTSEEASFLAAEDDERSHPSMPEIHVSSEMIPSHSRSGEDISMSLVRSGPNRKLSKSSEDLDSGKSSVIPSSSHEVTHLLVQEEMILDTESMSSKMKTSHSESAIQDFSLPSLNLPNPLSSPIIIKKDLVLSPLSRIAKGVQSLGMNFRPNAKLQRSPETEEHIQMKEKRKQCKTHIIEL